MSSTKEISSEERSGFEADWGFDPSFVSRFLADQLYKDDLAAYREYIQNEVDAGAKRISIRQNIEGKRITHIEMSGDGHGLYDLGPFLLVGTQDKLSDPSNVGGKGVGHFAYFKLGDEAVFTSSCPQGTKIPEIYRDKDIGELMPQLEILLRKEKRPFVKPVKANFSHGTRLIINEPKTSMILKADYLGKLVAPLLRSGRLRLQLNGLDITAPALPEKIANINIQTKAGLITGFIGEFGAEGDTSGTIRLYCKNFLVREYTEHNLPAVPDGEVYNSFLIPTGSREDVDQRDSAYTNFKMQLNSFLSAHVPHTVSLKTRLHSMDKKMNKIAEELFSDVGFIGTIHMIQDADLDTYVEEPEQNNQIDETSGKMAPTEAIISTGDGYKKKHSGREAKFEPLVQFYGEGNAGSSKRKGAGVLVRNVEMKDAFSRYSSEEGVLYVSQTVKEEFAKHPLNEPTARMLTGVIYGMALTGTNSDLFRRVMIKAMFPSSV